MHPTGDELRQALSRKEPSADFEARVMQQVRAAGRQRRFPLKRWSIVGAIAASLTVGIYVRQQRRATPPALPTAEAELAGEQLLESLQLAGWQIHKAREAVLEPLAEESQ
jgi:hypothetical protein